MPINLVINSGNYTLHTYMCGSPKKRRYLQVLLHSPGGSIYAKAINSSYLENQYQAQALDMAPSCIMQIKWAALPHC
jgi:hypothetical protein